MKRVHHVTPDAPPHQVGEEGESILQKRETLVLGSGSNVVHFTGIKGVGMTALALVMQDQGWHVQGSDTKEWFITEPVLKKRNIKVFDRFSPRNISTIEDSRWKPAVDTLIYSGAHHGVYNVEVKWAASRNIPTVNYAKALGEVFRDKKQICVCGVGGKTTTTAMLATILHRVDLDPSWVIGTSEVSSLPAPGRYGKGEWAVLESDEYVADLGGDRTPKFLYLSPNIIICTNIHHDHPDVYPSIKETVAAYERFFQRLPSDGYLFISSQAAEMLEREHLPFSVTVFDEKMDGPLSDAVRNVLSVPGEYNVRNALAALAAVEHIGVGRRDALDALKTFTGSKRRFEHIATVNGVLIYDDYAHHPFEISELVRAARERFPNQRIRVVFQPHTFSRTKALRSEFVRSLINTDEAILFPIFASAREATDPTVNSEILSEEVTRYGGKARYIDTKKKLVEYLCQSARTGDVIMTVGAGNLYDIHDDLVSCLRQTRKASSKK